MGGDDHKEKTTKMVLKVDLQCPCCYKKAKKILCKMPQVRDQLYDEKANTITIVVVCCSPERIRDKLCCKGGKTIKSIEIKKPKVVTFDVPEVKEPKTPKNKPQKPTIIGKPEKPTIIDKPEKPTIIDKPEKPTIIDKPKDNPKDSEKPKGGAMAAMVATPWISEPMMMMPPVQGYPQAMPGCGCGQCYYNGGLCYQYYGTPVPPQPAPYYGNYSYGYGPGPRPDPSSYGKVGHVNNDYYYEENGQGCTIM